MGSRRSRRSRRRSNQGNPSSENSPRAARIEALLDQVQKIDLSGIAEEGTRAIVGLLLNLVEDLRIELKKAHQEIAYLRERLRSEEHTSELQSRSDLVCRLLLEKKKKT